MSDQNIAILSVFAPDPRKTTIEILLTILLMLISLNMKAHAEDRTYTQDELKFYPVQLICPSQDRDGALRLFSENSLGAWRRVRVTYRDNLAQTVELALKLPGGTYTVDINENRNSRIAAATPEARIAQGFAILTDSLKSGVCEAGQAEKDKYYKELSENKKKFSGAKN